MAIYLLTDIEMNIKQPNLMSRFMKTVSQIESNELRSVLLAFALVFTLMAAWYILRPVRDAMASEWTDTEVSFYGILIFWLVWWLSLSMALPFPK